MYIIRLRGHGDKNEVVWNVLNGSARNWTSREKFHVVVVMTFHLYLEEPTEVGWAAYRDAPWLFHARPVSGMFHVRESPGQTQDPLKTLHLLVDLRTSGNLQVDLRAVAGDRGVWTDLHSLFPL